MSTLQQNAATHHGVQSRLPCLLLKYPRGQAWGALQHKRLPTHSFSIANWHRLCLTCMEH